MKSRADKWSNLSCPHCKKLFSLGVRIPMGEYFDIPAYILISQDDEVVAEWVNRGGTETHNHITVN